VETYALSWTRSPCRWKIRRTCSFDGACCSVTLRWTRHVLSVLLLSRFLLYRCFSTFHSPMLYESSRYPSFHRVARSQGLSGRLGSAGIHPIGDLNGGDSSVLEKDEPLRLVLRPPGPGSAELKHLFSELDKTLPVWCGIIVTSTTSSGNNRQQPLPLPTTVFVLRILLAFFLRHFVLEYSLGSQNNPIPPCSPTTSPSPHRRSVPQI